MTAGRRLARLIPPLRKVLDDRERLRRDRTNLLAERYVWRTTFGALRDQIATLTKAVDSLASGSERPAESKLPHDIDSPTASYSYVFIVTYGRSGSTLLQGVLNSIPGYLVRGENRQALLSLFEFEQTILSRKELIMMSMEEPAFRLASNSYGLPNAEGPFVPPSPSSATSPFFGIEGYDRQVAHQLFNRLARETLLRPSPGDRVLGFKEVKWPATGLLHYLKFLQEVFPNARFVINTRNLNDVAKSKWWGKDVKSSFKHLKSFEAELLKVGDALGDDAFHVHYNDWSRHPEALSALFDWLGEPFDLDRVRGVLKVPHSY